MATEVVWQLKDGKSKDVRASSSVKESIEVSSGDYMVLVVASGIGGPVRAARMQLSVVCGLDEMLSYEKKLYIKRKQRRVSFTVPNGSNAVINLKVTSAVLAKPIRISASVMRAGDAGQSFLIKSPSYQQSGVVAGGEESEEEDGLDVGMDDTEINEAAKRLEELENKMFDPNKLSKNKRKLYDEVCAPFPKIINETSLTYDMSACFAEAAKESQWKNKAYKKGLIRPFLCLVSMPPQLRLRYARALEIEMIECSFFGDSHQEAYHMLTKDRLGIQGRANHACTDTMNPVGKNANWYQILQRVCKKNFVESGKVEKETKAEIKSSRLSHKKSLPLCKDKYPGTLLRLEDLFIRAFAEVLRTVQQNRREKDEDNGEAERDRLVLETDPRVDELLQQLQDAGFNDDETNRFIVCTVLQGKGRALIAGLRSWYQKKKDSNAKGRAQIVFPLVMIVATTVLLPMAPVVPLTMFALNTARHVFRETPGRLLVPLIGINVQRVLFAFRNRSLEEFYPKNMEQLDEEEEEEEEEEEVCQTSPSEETATVPQE